MKSMRILAFFGYLSGQYDDYQSTQKWGRIIFNIFLNILLIPSVGSILFNKQISSYIFYVTNVHSIDFGCLWEYQCKRHGIDFASILLLGNSTLCGDWSVH